MENYKFVQENLLKATKCYPHLIAVRFKLIFPLGTCEKQLNTPTFNCLPLIRSKTDMECLMAIKCGCI